MNIAFIGLGIMGKPMAKNLIKAGHTLYVYDIVESAVKELVEAGATACESSKEAASKAPLIITMLPNSPHVKTVVLGENGVIEGASEGSVLIDMSSISPIASKEIAAELKKKGIEMLDAPVSGGEPKAVDGTVAIMVGGKKEVFDKYKDILLIMGSTATLTGEIGSGNTTKLANQIMVAANIAGMSEALVMATKAGVDPEKIYMAIRAGLAGSTVLDAKAPLVLEGKFAPGFRIDLHVKDLMNAYDTAEAVDTPIPVTKVALEIMKELQSDGKGSNDHGGMIQYYEKHAGIEARKE